MKIRRYFGHDCNSIEGFNNGYYIDSDYIEVKDHDHAEKLCIEFLKERYDFETTFEDSDIFYSLTENTIELTTSYSDSQGFEISGEDYEEEAGHTFTYVFVNYEVID